MEQVIVMLLVFVASVYAFWSLAGMRSRLAVLRALESALPSWAPPRLRDALSTIRRRLESASGCTACAARTRSPGGSR